ncbi:GNAT family N-acetyltransferase [Leisingera methylohalidivorans]|uniref:GCN5 family N-acetyltransferase n=1 Tax=Leisingera methylohalidivorans DSM 14336 TaxID=999552 RepID=V9VYZ2_9RHOB|nr:GNAT family N-acetyltransferase [Leisingera methylohalidivorans]AHD02122.1 GCN5 family N-acetyltransferase [Leisingera methylohalidivorans DSM 14336]
MTAQDFELRPLRESDRAEWARLWTGYLAFYETALAEEIYEGTFARLMSGAAWEPSALVLTSAGSGDGPQPLAGLVHFLYHAHCWKPSPVCYLQDLYVDPGIRGQGLGRRLIEGVYAAADEAAASGVYWMTQHFNSQARQLYDRIGVETPFIKYQRP